MSWNELYHYSLILYHFHIKKGGVLPYSVCAGTRAGTGR